MSETKCDHGDDGYGAYSLVKIEDGEPLCGKCRQRFIPSDELEAQLAEQRARLDVLAECRRVVELHRATVAAQGWPLDTPEHLRTGTEAQKNGSLEYLAGLLRRIDGALVSWLSPPAETAPSPPQTPEPKPTGD